MSAAIDKALILLDLQKEALNATSSDALKFLITNKTHALIDYSHAVFWTGTPENPKPALVSGNTSLDDKSPYAQWFSNTLKSHLADKSDPIVHIKASELTDEDKSKWAENAAPYALIMSFKTSEEGALGGLWIERKTPFDDAEIALLEELHSAYCAALALQKRRIPAQFLSGLTTLKKHQKLFWLALIVLAIFPVRLSITAPAEIISQSPGVVSAPFNSSVEDITVKPGDTVKENDVLVIMERQKLESDRQAAQQALEIARTNLSSIRRQALTSPEKKAELEVLQAEIDIKKIEYDFTSTLLERSEIKAPRDGIAIFSDANSIIGKPVAAGEKIMLIADPAKAELLVRIPADAMLPINKQSPAKFYLNVAPLKGYEAQILSIGYQASADADGLLTYKLRAKLNEQDKPRIGWKGTAKIHGQWSILSYAMLRRPLITLRKLIGV